jgi:hypothetical protein
MVIEFTVGGNMLTDVELAGLMIFVVAEISKVDDKRLDVGLDTGLIGPMIIFVDAEFTAVEDREPDISMVEALLGTVVLFVIPELANVDDVTLYVEIEGGVFGPMIIFVDTALALVELEVGGRDMELTGLMMILVLVKLSGVDDESLDVTGLFGPIMVLVLP